LSDQWYALTTQVHQSAVDTRERLDDVPWLKLIVLAVLLFTAAYVLVVHVYSPWKQSVERSRQLASAIRPEARPRL
jgi:hypothetical protein